jgi:L-ascorbate metabolism protein UlaG (beta-lactamase superfamily)
MPTPPVSASGSPARSWPVRAVFPLLGLLSLVALGVAWGQSTVSYYTTDVEPTSMGDLRITPIHHASVMLEWRGKIIDVDPVGVPYFTGLPKADLILITHAHGDHMDPKTIALVRKPGTIFVVPAAVKQTITEAQVVMSNGQSRVVNVGGVRVPIQAVAMYNIVHKRPDGQPYHPKGWGNGYILTLGGKRIYFSGDTECVPEVQALRNIDVAFLCMNLPYTMTPSDAAACVKDFRPKIVYPYHYQGQNPQVFADALKGEKGITVRMRNMYMDPPK